MFKWISRGFGCMSYRSERESHTSDLHIKPENASIASCNSTSIGAVQSMDTSLDWEDDVYISMIKLAEVRRFQGMHRRVGDKLIHHSRCDEDVSDSWSIRSWSNDPIGV